MNVIIIGATSGIGYELARMYAARGNNVGVTGRRREILESMNMPYRVLDISYPAEATAALLSLIDEMNSVDIVIISSGTGHSNEELDFDKERPAIDVNVLGFTAMADCAYQYFNKQGRGHIVGISSVAGLFPGRFAPAYSASKAYMISYLTSLRAKARHSKSDILVTDLRPGFVKTPLVEGLENMFWVAPVEKAAMLMIRAIDKHRSVAYITKKWRIIAVILRILPRCLHERI